MAYPNRCLGSDSSLTTTQSWKNIFTEQTHHSSSNQRETPNTQLSYICTLCLRKKKEISGHVITCVSCELKWSTEVSIPCCCPGPHMKHIRSQGIQAFNVSIPGGCFHNAIAALVLVLTTKEHSGDQVKISHCTMNRGTPLPCQNCHDETRWVATMEFSKYVPRAPAVGLAQYPSHCVLHGALSKPQKDDEAVGMMLVYHWLFKKSHNEILWKIAKPSNRILLTNKQHFTHTCWQFFFSSYQPGAI